jgi:microcompartment protein CcmK/EutM
MLPGYVIGKVTCSRLAENMPHGSYLVVSRAGKAELTGENTSKISKQYSPVVFDQFGAGSLDPILYVEGAEAMAPFEKDKRPPLDALSVALLDKVVYEP